MNHREGLSKKKWIQWVLDFVQTDLQTLSESRKHSFIEEACRFTSLLHLGNRLVEHERWQNILKPAYTSILKSRLRKVQDALRSVLEWIFKITSKMGTSDYPLPTIKQVMRIVEGRFARSTVQDIAKWEYWENIAVLNFCQLLYGLDSHSIRKCKGCGRYFVDLTRRNKLFCTPQCASRSIARRKREELRKDPKKYQAYLERQKKYMEKRYREMRKAQLGPNVRVGRKED